MKLKQILLFSFSLLMVSLFPTRVYGNESSQSIGDDNNCPAQIIDSHKNNITCNIYINKPEATPSVNQPDPAPEPEISNSSSGLIPTQNPEPEISNSSSGLIPTQNPEPQI